MTQVATAWYGSGTTSSVDNSGTPLDLTEAINEPSAASPFSWIDSSDELTISVTGTYRFIWGGNVDFASGAAPQTNYCRLALQEQELGAGAWIATGSALDQYPGQDYQGGSQIVIVSASATDIFRLFGVASAASHTYHVAAWLEVEFLGLQASWLEIQNTAATVLAATGAPPRLVAGFLGYYQQAVAQGTGLHTDPVQGAADELASFLSSTVSRAARDGGAERFVTLAIEALDNYAADAAAASEGPAES